MLFGWFEFVVLELGGGGVLPLTRENTKAVFGSPVAIIQCTFLPITAILRQWKNLLLKAFSRREGSAAM